MAKKMIEGLINKGQEILGTVGAELMEKPAVQQAFSAAMQQKGKVDAAIGTGLKKMNIVTRAEFRSLRARVESLEAALAEMKEAQKTPPKKSRSRTK